MFAPGDEVVCLSRGTHPDWTLIEVGAVYVVSHVYPPDAECPEWGLELAGVVVSDTFSIDVENATIWRDIGWDASRFRKVQKRNRRLTIEAFMTMPGGFEEPRRAPAKKRERAQ